MAIEMVRELCANGSSRRCSARVIGTMFGTVHFSSGPMTWSFGGLGSGWLVTLDSIQRR